MGMFGGPWAGMQEPQPQQQLQHEPSLQPSFPLPQQQPEQQWQLQQPQQQGQQQQGHMDSQAPSSSHSSHSFSPATASSLTYPSLPQFSPSPPPSSTTTLTSLSSSHAHCPAPLPVLPAWLDESGGRDSIAAAVRRLADSSGLARGSTWWPGKQDSTSSTMGSTTSDSTTATEDSTRTAGSVDKGEHKDQQDALTTTTRTSAATTSVSTAHSSTNTSSSSTTTSPTHSLNLNGSSGKLNGSHRKLKGSWHLEVGEDGAVLGYPQPKSVSHRVASLLQSVLELAPAVRSPHPHPTAPLDIVPEPWRAAPLPSHLPTNPLTQSDIRELLEARSVDPLVVGYRMLLLLVENPVADLTAGGRQAWLWLPAFLSLPAHLSTLFATARIAVYSCDLRPLSSIEKC